jgi:hypothetical protein
LLMRSGFEMPLVCRRSLNGRLSAFASSALQESWAEMVLMDLRRRIPESG